ncbi:hypothetical protein WB401_13120 [Streptomyces brasiliscabiei]|uniref:Integrase n=1 Tax=Streptomyces brasiliscabiei TaxID=2736302 RepID=A0ABU8GL15_9ACTN
MQPPADYRRPELVDDSGLVVRAVGQDGRDLGTYDFRECPGSEQLRKTLVAAFARCTRVRWTSTRSCKSYANDLKLFFKEIAARKRPVRTVAQITPRVWEDWLAPSMGRRRLSSVLLEVDGLPTDTRYALTMRRLGSGHKPSRKQGYTKSEIRQVRDAAARTVRAARIRIEANAQLLQRWQAGDLDTGAPDQRWGEVLDHVIRHGDLPRQPCGHIQAWAKRELQARFREEHLPQGLLALFPSPAEIGAAAVLLICHEAWNLSVLQEMKVPQQWPNADQDSPAPAIHWVESDKPRRGTRRRHNSHNLVDAGEHTAGWAMQQVLAMTDPARRSAAHLGLSSEALLVTRRQRTRSEQSRIGDGTIYLGDQIASWVARERVAGTGLPPNLTAARLRHSVQVFLGPRNNTQRVHEDFYLRRDETVTDEAKDVVEAGLNKAVSSAYEQVRMRFIGAVDDDPEARGLAATAGITRERADQVLAGELDTAVGACEDFEHSPMTPDGPCTVSFLMCFACPNAIATARHLPRIVYLFQALEQLRAVVDSAVWRADWAGHHARVGDLVGRHTDPSRWPGLLARLGERERDLIDQMLARRLDP